VSQKSDNPPSNKERETVGNHRKASLAMRDKSKKSRRVKPHHQANQAGYEKQKNAMNLHLSPLTEVAKKKKVNHESTRLAENGPILLILVTHSGFLAIAPIQRGRSQSLS
jgi:hypothetical protein